MYTATRLLLLVALAAVALAPARAQITGQAVPEMAHYDTGLQALFTQYHIPGAAVAVTRNGRLVYARGFGMADVGAGEAVQPDARFRIASISKPITAVAVMKLVEEGRLSLDAPAFAYLPDLPAPAGQTEDARLASITIRHLLEHAGGWDRDATGYDPMFDVRQIATAMGVPSPAPVEAIIRYMRGRPLDFPPGARYAYSNFGYAVLGEIIERVTGESYESYVLGVLAPAGITQMQLGRSLLADRLPGEVRYYAANNATATSVFPPYATVPWPYGGFELEAMDAHGRWVTSAPDLLRFMEATDGRTGRPDVLTAQSIQTMTARPAVSTWNGTSYWYGLGWQANTNGHWWHDGSLPGTRTLLVRANYQGLAWTVLCNTRPEPDGGFYLALDDKMWTLATSTTTWPTHDLFPLYSAAEPGATAPSDLALSAPTPNPAAGTATLALTLGRPSAVRVAAFDALGREVAVLHDGTLPAGSHALRLETAALPAGVYVVRATGEAGTAVRRVTVGR